MALTNVMRFYRAASHDAWRTNRNPRSVSEEVYALKTFLLRPGRNWISIPIVPDSNTIARVLGHGMPAGTMMTGTRIALYNRSTTAAATCEVYLASSPLQWTYISGGSGSADNMSLPINEGFVIEIPTSATRMYMAACLGRVPIGVITNVMGGFNSINLVGFNLPRQMHPSQMNLLESGFQGGAIPPQSDRIYKWRNLNSAGFTTENQYVPETIWYRTNDRTWRFATTGWPLVPTNYFNPDDAFVIQQLKSTGNWKWTNRIIYPVPTYKMNP
jgi:hypothetical protein